MKMQSVKCPSCGAPFSVDTEKGAEIFCPYCGTKTMVNDLTFEIKYNHTNRNIDDAEIRRVDAEKEVELKKLEAKMKRSKQHCLIIVLFVIIAATLVCFLEIHSRSFSSTPSIEKTNSNIPQSYSTEPSAVQAAHESTEPSVAQVAPESTELPVTQVALESTELLSTQDTVPESTERSNDETYPVPTNTEISYGFLDCTLFTEIWQDGVYRCGTDFPAGDYFVMSIVGAEAMYDVEGSPNDFSWSRYRILRRVTVKDGQYVRLPRGGVLVHANEVDTSSWEKYGVFLVGKDLPEGEYKITTMTDYCTQINTQGVRGAYQISNDSPENTPESCSMLFDNQDYITLKNGQYLIITNAQLTLCAPAK